MTHLSLTDPGHSGAALLTSECRLMFYLRAEDFDRGRQFYQHLLGFPVRHEWNDDGRGVMFDCGGCIIELIDPGPGREIPAPVGVSLKIPDVVDLWKRLSPQVPSAGPLRQRPWGDTDFELRDPGGFRVIFFTPTGELKGESHEQ